MRGRTLPLRPLPPSPAARCQRSSRPRSTALQASRHSSGLKSGSGIRCIMRTRTEKLQHICKVHYNRQRAAPGCSMPF